MTTPLVQVKIELGHKAILRTKPSAEGHTHDWTVFARGPEGCDIQNFIDKIVFNLHPTFPKPKRVIKEPPYQVAESGYAGFNVDIDIHFKNKSEPKRIRFMYDLFLKTDGPVNHIRCEKLTFQNPIEDFRRRLLKSGGTGILSAATEDDNVLSTIPPQIKRPQTYEDKTFQNLFGDPIIKEDQNKKKKVTQPEKKPQDSTTTSSTVRSPAVDLNAKGYPEKSYKSTKHDKPEKQRSHSHSKELSSKSDKDHSAKQKSSSKHSSSVDKHRHGDSEKLSQSSDKSDKYVSSKTVTKRSHDVDEDSMDSTSSRKTKKKDKERRDTKSREKEGRKSHSKVEEPTPKKLAVSTVYSDSDSESGDSVDLDHDIERERKRRKEQDKQRQKELEKEKKREKEKELDRQQRKEKVRQNEKELERQREKEVEKQREKEQKEREKESERELEKKRQKEKEVEERKDKERELERHKKKERDEKKKQKQRDEEKQKYEQEKAEKQRLQEEKRRKEKREEKERRRQEKERARQIEKEKEKQKEIEEKERKEREMKEQLEKEQIEREKIKAKERLKSKHDKDKVSKSSKEKKKYEQEKWSSKKVKIEKKDSEDEVETGSKDDDDATEPQKSTVPKTTKSSLRLDIFDTQSASDEDPFGDYTSTHDHVPKQKYRKHEATSFKTKDSSHGTPKPLDALLSEIEQKSSAESTDDDDILSPVEQKTTLFKKSSPPPPRTPGGHDDVIPSKPNNYARKLQQDSHSSSDSSNSGSDSEDENENNSDKSGSESDSSQEDVEVIKTEPELLGSPREGVIKKAVNNESDGARLESPRQLPHREVPSKNIDNHQISLARESQSPPSQDTLDVPPDTHDFSSQRSNWISPQEDHVPKHVSPARNQNGNKPRNGTRTVDDIDIYTETAPNGEVLAVLLDLRKRLALLTDKQVLTHVVSIILRAGAGTMNRVSDSFDFDLCKLDAGTLKQIQTYMEEATR